MMKLIVGLFVLAVVANSAYGEMKCGIGAPKIPSKWSEFPNTCMSAMRKQIQKEIDASYVYFAMGAHFSRDTINRPGFADFFFNSAKEEREHGSKLIEYLSMRGQLTTDVTSLINIPNVETHTWADGATAIQDALELETEVTESIRSLIKVCEKAQQYHLVDYLTGVYLEEQLHGQRELAGKLSTLKKMMTNHGALGEFLFDKQM